MSESATPSPVSPTPPAGAAAPKLIPQEIKVISHSHLFYWWPIWFFGFLFSFWTYVDNNRLAIVGPESKIKIGKADQDQRELVTIQVVGDAQRLKADAEPVKDDNNAFTPKIRVSPRTWMGPFFFVVLFLVILITNVPLRGLWSLVTVILIFMAALILSLLDKWDDLLRATADLHIYVNLAGYLAISVALFIAWVAAVFLFDRRTYIVFTPGQVRVCEEIGGREKVYDSMGLALEKRRDDWFRHIFLGFGTGDLTVKTSGAERHEIVLPNVVFIAFKIGAIEQMMRMKQMAK